MRRLTRGLVPVLATLLLLTLGWTVSLRYVVQVRADMADLLPPGSTPAARLLARELRSGAASSLLIVALEGAQPERLAEASRALADGLRRSGRFGLVANGAEGLDEGERDSLFRHRYLLSPAITADAFATDRLRAGLEGVLRGLGGSASPLAKRYGLADPTGAFLTLVQGWAGESRVELRDGVWFAQGGGRALLLARTGAAGLDVEAGRATLDAVHAAFAQADPGGGVRLIVSGPAAFAVEAAAAIKADVQLLSVLASVVIAGFLFWRYRSLLLLATVAVPLAAGALAGALLTQLAFGSVHGITLGFGMTMLGVADDYPLTLTGERRPGEAALATARRIGPTLALAVGTGALGLTAMLLSSFPGLAQLGLFSAAGLVVAGAVTRWLLPRLLAGSPSPEQRVPDSWMAGTDRLRRLRWPLLLPVALAAAYLAYRGGPAWETDLANLSPVPESARDLDGELRRELGAPDVRHLVAISGPDAEAVLRASERLDAALAPLRARGDLGGADLPSRYMPSTQTQRERQAALPPPDELRARLAEALAGLPFRPEAFERFLADVEAARAMPSVTPADLAGAPALAARLEPLLSERDGAWQGLAALVDVARPEAVRDAVAALGGDPAGAALTYVDVKGETERTVAAYTGEVLGWLALGALAMLAVVALALRRPGPVLRVAAPLACAALVTLALLDLAGARLTLFHLAALLLMAGVSLDYALFLNREPESGEDDARTLGAVLNCNATTLLTFGLLVLCRNPVLQGIGATVATGALAAVFYALVLSRPSAEAG